MLLMCPAEFELRTFSLDTNNRRATEQSKIVVYHPVVVMIECTTTERQTNSSHLTVCCNKLAGVYPFRKLGLKRTIVLK